MFLKEYVTRFLVIVAMYENAFKRARNLKIMVC